MLTVSRSPLRISFFGGGTDYPEYFNDNESFVLGSAINKYVYTACLPMIGYAENKFRITYRAVEAVDHVDDIQHNAVRAVLKESGFDDPLNIAMLSDLPGNSGLGSSSSFTVGFIRLISHLQGRRITKYDLMREAVRIEREVLGENVGVQDQTYAAFGGLNLYKFHKTDFSIQPVRIHTENRDALDASLCLVYTGVQRFASATVEEQLANTREQKITRELKDLGQLCFEGLSILESQSSGRMLEEFGELLSEGWRIKRSLADSISNDTVNQMYEAGIAAGALGGKLCGAGKGGFLLFVCPPQHQPRLIEVFGANNFVKIELDDQGARILNV